MKITVLDGYCLNTGDLSWDALRAFGEVEVFDRTPADQVVERAAGAAIALTNKTPMPAAALDQLPDLRYIGVLATGYNVIDIEAAKRKGIVVSNVPTYGTASVSQFVFALLLELCHRVQLHADAVRAGEWTASPDWCFSKSPLIELEGKTMGVIGYGRIGRQTARIAEAFGMSVLWWDKPPGVSSLEDLLQQSDVISLHVPLTAETREMINARTLALMKPTAILINTARGPLIQEADLAEALNRSRIAGAALDVLSMEPPPARNPLLTARNCLITPHMAWATTEARRRLMTSVIENVAAFLKGQPKNVVF
ncbi:MAG: D-2-hydroxyacid dehydrogenase [Bryobacteraceae bacterium]|jgi:glycerate dehydrogenase